MNILGRKTVLSILFFFLLTTCFTASARQEKKNIYLFDCTGSMQKGPDGGLWTPAKRALEATVTTQSTIPNSEFVIIPFGNEAYEVIRFCSEGYASKKKSIDETFDNYIKEATLTHITETLNAGFAQIDPARENKVYLLTDGQPNGGDSPEKVAECISKWCGAHRNTRFFYVALKENVVNPVILKAIDNCPDAYVVQCGGNIIPQIGDISSDVHGNIEELDNVHQLGFSIPGSYPMTAVSEDPLFDVEIPGGKSANGIIPLRITSRGGLSAEELHQQTASLKDASGNYTFTVSVTSPDSKYFIANPTVTVTMADHIQSRMTIADNETELAGDACSWYDSFLWSGASELESVEFDLSPAFANVTSPDACVRMSLSPAEGQPDDFKAYYNDNLITNGTDFVLRPCAPAIVRIVFNTDAQEGKRYFRLKNEGSTGIDIINGTPSDDFEGISLRSRYSVHWNPLKTWCFWIVIVIIGLLIAWILIIRKFFYPAIKIGKVEFTTPGRYFSKKIKGASKAVLTSRTCKQGVLSRIFTGRIIYIKDDVFSPEIEIVPGTHKKIRFRSTGTGDDRWDFEPGATFGPFSDGKASKSSDGSKFEFTIN